MGFRFRRSVKILPGVRLNLSGSGASVSLGPRGFRYTVGSKGTRVTAGIPGTGLSWSQYTPHSNSRPNASEFFDYSSQPETEVPIGVGQPALRRIESASAEKINAFSTSELAPILNAANRRLQFASLILLISVLLFVLALVHGNQLWQSLSALYATICIPLAITIDRYRRSVKITYEPQGPASQIASALGDSFNDLASCNSVWRVQAEGNTADWKRNAGATVLNQRKRIQIGLDRPTCIRRGPVFPALKSGKEEIYFFPDAALIVANGSVAAVPYHQLNVLNSRTKFIEEERPPADAPIVGYTWRYVNKKGGPDRRFNSNKQLPVCLYGELHLSSVGGLNCKIHYSNPEAASRLCNVIGVLHNSSLELPKAISYIKTAKRWPTVCFFACAALLGACQLLFLPGVQDRIFLRLPAPTKLSETQSAAPLPTVQRENVKIPDYKAFPAPQTVFRPIQSIENGPVNLLPGTVPLPRPRPKLSPPTPSARENEGLTSQ